MKLHLGCFHRKIYGFTNVDIREEVNPDLVDDVFKLEKIANNSVSLIFCSHVLEHANRNESLQALKRWYEVLSPGGELYVSVPDLDVCFRHYMLYQDLRYLQNFLYGSQKHDYDYHFTGFTERTLTEDLMQVGFSKISRYDWHNTDWFYVDSYEQAYFPHMRKTDGVLMSLNLKAVK